MTILGAPAFAGRAYQKLGLAIKEGTKRAPGRLEQTVGLTSCDKILQFLPGKIPHVVYAKEPTPKT